MAEAQEGLNTFVSKLGLIWSRFMPDWGRRRIDAQMFVYNAAKGKGFRLPRGVERKSVQTPDGDVCVYRTGTGPAVVFVHGWGGGAYEFFSLMRGLKECGYTAIAFDQLGHEGSAPKPATLQQMIKTTNYMLHSVIKSHEDGLLCVVGHGLGCVAVANSSPAVIDKLPLMMISPIFNFKLYFLKRLGELKLHSDILKQYAQDFTQRYVKDYSQLELTERLPTYSRFTTIAHDSNDQVTPVSATEKLGELYPGTRLLITGKLDHKRITSSESVWQELKRCVDYEDTTINFSQFVKPDEF